MLAICCAVWSYPGWVGEVYPPKTPARDFLRVYSNYFSAVEGNTTFYAIPDRQTIPFSIIRYVSHPIRSANQAWLEGWTSQIKHWLERDIQIYMFVHCPIEARSPINARYLHEIFTAAGIALAPLPPQPIDNSPTQLRLF
jgi:uncharacterized protein YecE (DUF72 family)